MPGYKAVDMKAFVRRSADYRIMRGKISRPMNAFILYRKAFVKVAGSLASVKHTEIKKVSQIIGASWKMETEELRDYFYCLAAEEKAQHELYFPKYKFLARSMAEYPLPRKQRHTNGGFKDSEEGVDAEVEDVIFAQPH
ncbi:hypothetical protein F4678DRAFT_435165 [Xylaria arbuscula]|nr:hypothetical protein F4678DRAFT_435165 [Xylaria arbuscula]